MDRTEEEVREEIRSFAERYRGRWRWTATPCDDCRAFQARLFGAVGLAEPVDQLHTWGWGCPLLYPIRSAGWAIADLVERARTALTCAAGRSRRARRAFWARRHFGRVSWADGAGTDDRRVKDR